ncbi:Hypoxia induced protein conserved region [Sulfitobacter marinus]|uniref:Hypoxia induced protein conserved region n=1 Tax=Sulfitobacter marinus TaxID=394264 RepID=A0A1I6VM67_9RHOB|nr:twin transmembrane helix small protein [Sulfitobacter marinus]SFT14524.1 Hypoxia induced protein conserved region [Sulfitobacter marinus]
MFSDPLFILVCIAVLAVIIILIMGLGGFASGGDFNKRNSNKLMRLRLISQFIAVVLIVIYVYLRKDAG